MKRKFKLLLGAVLLFTSCVTIAQSTSGETVNGTPYLDEAYAKGVICYANKNHVVPIRYNAFRDLIEYQQSGTAFVLDPNAAVKKVTFGNTTFVPMPYEANGKSKYGYFAMLDSGKVSLFVKKKITFVAAKKGGALDGSDQQAEYRKLADTFYYKISDGKLQEVNSIKSMIASFPDKQEELTKFARKEKISPHKEKELIQFVQYYNSL
jgi:hypothetical protein